MPEEALEDAFRGLDTEQITGPGGLITQLAGRVIEAALGAELTEHLGYPPGRRARRRANVRNGSTPKTLDSDLGEVAIRTPRDRDASLSRSWWPSARRGWRAWTTRSSRSTPAA